MCHATPCRRCGNTTWAGCGSHVAAVRAQVPAGQWCAGHTSTVDADPPRRGPARWFSRR